MARLFGIISPQPFDLTVSLSTQHQAIHKTHGWGLGWYNEQGKPNVQKGKRSTLNQYENAPVQQSVRTSLAVAHTRVATSGTITDANAHPFEYKNYLFAHNGTVHKEKLLSLLKPPFNQNFQSEPIDSEVYFRFILQSIQEQGQTQGLRTALKEAASPRGSNFVLTDGKSLIAFRHGLPLHFLRWKVNVPLNVVTRETAVIYQSKALATQQAFIVSSEILTKDHWNVFDDEELIMIEKNLTYRTIKIV